MNHIKSQKYAFSQNCGENELICLPYITHTHTQIHNIQVDEDLNIKGRTLNILKGNIRNIFLL